MEMTRGTALNILQRHKEGMDVDPTIYEAAKKTIRAGYDRPVKRVVPMKRRQQALLRIGKDAREKTNTTLLENLAKLKDANWEKLCQQRSLERANENLLSSLQTATLKLRSKNESSNKRSVSTAESCFSMAV